MEFRVLSCHTVNFARRETLDLSSGRQRCWFCGEEDPTAFKRIAHVVPHALGNKHLVTREECDPCNIDYFAKEIDDSFLKALQPYRLLHAARGKSGRITLCKSGKSESRVRLAVPENRLVELNDTEDDPMIEVLNFGSGEIIVQLEVPAHDPIAVPKALARMGMLVCRELRGAEYDWLRRWVLGRRADGGEVSLLPVHHFRAHTTLATPNLVLQVMEVPSAAVPPECPRHLVLLWFAQAAFLFPIPRSPNATPKAFPLLGRMPGIDAHFQWQQFTTRSEGKLPSQPARVPIGFDGYDLKLIPSE